MTKHHASVAVTPYGFVRSCTLLFHLYYALMSHPER